MEGWPIEMGDMTYFLEREGNVLKRVCVAFSGVGIEHAPSFKSANDEREVPHVEISGGIYSVLARKNIMNWQAVLSGRSEEHTSELQSLMRHSYAVFCLKKKKYK